MLPTPQLGKSSIAFWQSSAGGIRDFSTQQYHLFLARQLRGRIMAVFDDATRRLRGTVEMKAGMLLTFVFQRDDSPNCL